VLGASTSDLLLEQVRKNFERPELKEANLLVAIERQADLQKLDFERYLGKILLLDAKEAEGVPLSPKEAETLVQFRSILRIWGMSL